MKVLLTGASGFIGRRFARLAEQEGHQILPVSRNPRGRGFGWSSQSLADGVAAADAIVHLAGENLFGERWTEGQKQILVRSRVDTTARLAALAAARRPLVLVSASAIGYYGPSDCQGLDEESPAGGDFLATLCRAWEDAVAPAKDAGVRTAIARLGIVLGAEGGALKQMLPPFKLGVGGPIGSGRQWMSWVHGDDVAALLLFLVETRSALGAYNITAPNPVTMREMATTLGGVLHRPALLPVPGFALRLVLGEVADVLLTGQHVVPRRAREAGFRFRFPSLEPALQDLLGKPA
jgi:uncharacterized protein (TIGR01777 family)